MNIGTRYVADCLNPLFNHQIYTLKCLDLCKWIVINKENSCIMLKLSLIIQKTIAVAIVNMTDANPLNLLQTIPAIAKRLPFCIKLFISLNPMMPDTKQTTTSISPSHGRIAIIIESTPRIKAAIVLLFVPLNTTRLIHFSLILVKFCISFHHVLIH